MILVKRLVRFTYNRLLNSRIFYWCFCLESGILLWYLNSLDSNFLILLLKLFALIQAITSFIFLIKYHTNLLVYGDWRGERTASFKRINQRLDQLRDDLIVGDEAKELEYWQNIELLEDYYTEFLDSKKDIINRSF